MVPRTGSDASPRPPTRTREGEAHHAPVTGTLLAVTLALVLASPASAQAPPPWKQASPPISPTRPWPRSPSRPPRRTASEIPGGQIKVPRAFKSAVGERINNARAMVWGDNGTLFVSSRVAATCTRCGPGRAARG